MTWSLNTNWIAASERAGVRVIGLVRIELQQTTALRIDDYSAINGSTMTVILNIGGTLYSVNEGSDYSATGSNITTATNIGDAILAEVGTAWTVRYQVESDASGAILTFIFGEAASATTSTTFQASVVDDPTGWGIDLGNGPTEVTFCKSHEPFIGTDGTYPNLVTDIRGLEMAVDPLTRELSLSEPEIDFADPGRDGYGIRSLMRRYMLFGKYVDIEIGFDGLAESDFEPWPRLYIQKVKPAPGGAVTVGLGDGLHELTTGTITGEWVGFHPLGVVEDILNQTVTPNRYDATTLDPTNSAYDPIGHWVVSRYNDEEYQCLNGINDPTIALDVLNSVLVLMNGTLRLTQAGVYGYTLLDEDAASVRSFSNSDTYTAGYPCRVTSYTDAFESLTNGAVMNFAQSRDTNAAIATYRETDQASVRETLRLVETTLDLEWCNAVALVGAFDILPGSGGSIRRIFPNTESFVIPHAPRQGFCGTRQSYNPATSSFSTISNSGLGLARTAFLRLEGRAYPVASSPNYTNDPEIVACDLVQHWSTPQMLDEQIANRPRPTRYINQYSDIALPTTYETLAYTWLNAQFSIDTSYSGYDFVNGRAGLGTSTAAARDGGITYGDGTSIYAPTRVVDVTIPVAIAKRWMRRCRFGMPAMTIEAGARHYDLELSDVVTMAGDDVFLAFQQSGVESGLTTDFEVVRKRCRLFEADPCMEYEVAFLRSTAYPGVDVVPIYDPTVTVLEVSTDTDFIVTNDNDPVTNDQDGDGFAESFTVTG
jgi:hypothetical protein